MNVSDETLAQAAARGDRVAFAALLDRQYDRLFGLCFRLTGRRDIAEDLTQDICLALPAKLKSFRGEARLSTWLYRIAVNAVHDWRRRVAADGRRAEAWGEVELARRAEAVEAEAAQTWLETAMAELPETLRDTLALLLDDDLTQSEAARILGISQGTVAWRMSEAKRLLRKMMEDAE